MKKTLILILCFALAATALTSCRSRLLPSLVPEEAAAGETASTVSAEDSLVEYGEPDSILNNDGPLLAYIRFPQAGGFADAAIFDWAMAAYDESLREIERLRGEDPSAEGEINVQFDSYLIDGKYVGISEKGMFMNSHLANPTEIVKTFNLDLEKGVFLEKTDVVESAHTEAVLTLLREKILDTYPGSADLLGDMDENWLHDFVIVHEGIQFILTRGVYLPSYLGTLAFTLTFDELGEALKLGKNSIPETSLIAKDSENLTASQGAIAADVPLEPLRGKYLEDDYMRELMASKENAPKQNQQAGQSSQTQSSTAQNQPSEQNSQTQNPLQWQSLSAQTVSTQILPESTPLAAAPTGQNPPSLTVPTGQNPPSLAASTGQNPPSLAASTGQNPPSLAASTGQNPLSAAVPAEQSQPQEQSLREGIDPAKPMVALTFDDGPSKHTPRVLDYLEKNNARATFCIVGNVVSGREDMVARAFNMGNEVIGHTWDHRSLTKLSREKILWELSETNRVIKEITGVEPKMYRPPYGALNNNVKNISAEVGMAIIYWSIDTLDWKTRNADAVYKAIMDKVSDRAIILCHDLHGTTADAMERVIPDLIAKGYQLVTVSELMLCSDKTFEAGKVYYSGK